MKFREFCNWANKRACDGMWGIGEAISCSIIIKDVQSAVIWKRKKLWEKHRETAERIVRKTNQLIKERGQ